MTGTLSFNILLFLTLIRQKSAQKKMLYARCLLHTGVQRRNLHLLFFLPGFRVCPLLGLSVPVLLLKVPVLLRVLLLLLTLLDRVFISYLVFWLRRELILGLTAGSWLYTSLRCGSENMVKLLAFSEDEKEWEYLELQTDGVWERVFCGAIDETSLWVSVMFRRPKKLWRSSGGYSFLSISSIGLIVSSGVGEIGTLGLTGASTGSGSHVSNLGSLNTLLSSVIGVLFWTWHLMSFSEVWKLDVLLSCGLASAILLSSLSTDSMLNSPRSLSSSSNAADWWGVDLALSAQPSSSSSSRRFRELQLGLAEIRMVDQNSPLIKSST